MTVMKIGIIGGGGVAQTFGAGLIALGHDVQLGIRNVTREELAKDRAQALPLADWQAKTGARVVTMAQAATHGELVVNATAGQGSLEALTMAGAANLKGKVLIDIANALDFSQGMPPFINPTYTGPTSLGEQIQAAFPDTRVVKAFNTVSAPAMVNAAFVPGDHDLLIAGNDPVAKAVVTDIARGFGWQHIVDLGDIVGARATESLLPLWVRMWMLGSDPRVNIHLVRAT
jgi:8-hydroxy-5-deazaflavin:NADPH oxidoreductase